MRDPKRIDKILQMIKDIWLNEPDLRFHQLIYNLQNGFSQKKNNVGKIEIEEQDGFTQIGFDFFNTEDDQFIEFLREKVESET